MPVGPADLHVLLALSRGALHGLGIAADVALVTDDAVILGPATLYRTLKELTGSGHVKLVDPPPDESDSRRKFYTLTPDGAARLEADMAVVRRVANAGNRRLRSLAAGVGA